MNKTHLEMQLPVRLTPRRSKIIYGIVFLSVCCPFFGVIVFTFLTTDTNMPSTFSEIGQKEIYKLISLGLFLWSLFGLTITALQALPGSPCDHVIINKRGLIRRFFIKRQQIDWVGISEFAVIRRSSGKSYKWVMLAEGIPAPIAARDGTRYRAAPLTFDLSAMLPFFATEEDAKSIASWLNTMLRDFDRGRVLGKLSVPRILNGVVLSEGSGRPYAVSVAGASKKRRAGGVIER